MNENKDKREKPIARRVRLEDGAPAVKETIPEAMKAPQKLKLLVVIVNRDKAEFYADLLQGYESNMQLILSAEGTARQEMLRYLGMTETAKSVILGIVREEKATHALARIEKKFDSVKGGRGVAFTVPLTGTIGVAVYQFLANIGGGEKHG